MSTAWAREERALKLGRHRPNRGRPVGGTSLRRWFAHRCGRLSAVARASRLRRTAGAKRRSREVDYPAHVSRDYRVDAGHDYVLNGVPLDIWQRAKKRAHAEQRAVRVVLIRALELYGNGQLNL